MIKQSYKNTGAINKYIGLSTDTKPNDAPNASVFYEMDTSATYYYDKENGEWILQKRV